MPCCVCRRDFVGADIEPAIHGRRIAADHFPIETLRERDAQRALARCGWPDDGHEQRSSHRINSKRIVAAQSNAEEPRQLPGASGYGRKNALPVRTSRCRLGWGLSLLQRTITSASECYVRHRRIPASADGTTCSAFFKTDAAPCPHRARKLTWLRRAATQRACALVI